MPDHAIEATPLTRGLGGGTVIRLDIGLSFWGGTDAAGVVVDAHHPQLGRSVAGHVLAMRSGRGSSSSSSVLAELIRSGHGPSAIVLARPDAIIALGAIVADELYAIAVPVVVVTEEEFDAVRGLVAVESDPDLGTASVTIR
ncbi:aconitase X swivel domain-containing protein [Knoellia sp. CPCC 206453]|uniref:aconitase X swivel domain-containing protein n=1 Tax=Knoellia pratensis TaxID=3404796 RepID=UPI00360DCFB5